MWQITTYPRHFQTLEKHGMNLEGAETGPLLLLLLLLLLLEEEEEGRGACRSVSG